MAMVLFRQTYADMLQSYPDEFNEFRRIHDLFRQDQTAWKSEFDRTGKIILRIITDTENRLCAKTENFSRGRYSSTLSDKFRNLVRSEFPLIDLVGVTVS